MKQALVALCAALLAQFSLWGAPIRWGDLQVSQRVLLRIGLYAGFRWSLSSAPEGREFGMALDGNLGIEYRFDDHKRAFLEVGFIGQPYGGVVDIAYVRGGPIPYLAAGIGLE